MSEQTAQGNARAAEERAKKQQRQVIRDVIRADAELRAEILADMRADLDEAARQAVTDEMNGLLRQAREQRLAEQIERQGERRARAPKQVSSSNGHGSPFGRDLEHSPEFVRALRDGKGYPQAMALAREAHPEAGRRRWQPGPAGNPAARTGSPYAGGTADMYAHRTESPDVLWETRNGPLKDGRSAPQLPRQADPWPARPGEPDPAAVVPPDHSSPLNRGI